MPEAYRYVVSIPKRKGQLRPQIDFLAESCRNGLEWVEIQRRLTVMGVNITASAVCAFCTRRGLVRLHPYSIHHDPTLTARFDASELQATDLTIFAPNKDSKA